MSGPDVNAGTPREEDTARQPDCDQLTDPQPDGDATDSEVGGAEMAPDQHPFCDERDSRLSDGDDERGRGIAGAGEE